MSDPDRPSPHVGSVDSHGGFPGGSSQENSPSYLLAFEDSAFLRREELRPVRFQLELWKPEMLQNEAGIRSTVVVFGSARIRERKVAEEQLQRAKENARQDPDNPLLARRVNTARRLLDKSRFYSEAREFAALMSRSCQIDGRCEYVVVTGGGPGIMEAANRGAFDVGAKSIGLNISLPFEQEPNHYITPQLSFQFHYFALRKMHFLMRAKALVVFPGGFGTFDELFVTLTLIQTGKVEPLPVLLYNRAFWERAIDFAFLAEEGTISPEDLDLIEFVETPEEAWKAIQNFYGE